MQLSPPLKIALVLAGLFALGLYLVVVDLGINAGRIHYGVSVDDVDVGGLTLIEAADALSERAEQLARQPVTFEADGFRKALTAEDVGWNANPFHNAQLAMQVGREGDVFVSLRDRIRAWRDGMEIPWRAGPERDKLTALLNEWEQDANEAGLEIRRGLLRYRISKALLTWPRRTFQIPLRPD